MKLHVVAVLVSLSLGNSLFALQGDAIQEGHNFAIGIDESSVEKTFEIHHPGLVEWYENGVAKHSYKVPGCFFVTGQLGEPQKVRRLVDSIEVLGPIHEVPLSLVAVNGTPAFVDLKVSPLYVGDYKVRAKDGRSFGELVKSIFGSDQKYPATLIFSRGCRSLALPPFVDQAR